MIIFCAIFIILLVKPYEIESQKLIHSEIYLKNGHNVRLKDYNFKSRIESTEDELRHIIQSLGPRAYRVIDPSKYCRSFRTCYECVNSIIYPCNWCHNYGCSGKEDKMCTVFTMGNYGIKNFSCPFIYTKTPLLIPSGTENHVAVKINAPEPELKDKNFICQINLRYIMIHAKGIIMQNTVYCFPPRLVIHTAKEVGALRLLWAGVEPYSNEIPIYVYRCEKMASNCFDCSTLPFKFGCGWCKNSEQCVVAEKCKQTKDLGWSFNEACLPNS